MEYSILGVHVVITGDNVAEPRTKYFIYAAWASNRPDLPFCWRCTEQELDHFPTWQDIQGEVAARGSDVRDKTMVKKMFPYLPPKSLTD